jgi:hypothetical protein
MLRAIAISLPPALVGIAVLTVFALLVQPTSALLYAAGMVITGFVVLAADRYDTRKQRKR